MTVIEEGWTRTGRPNEVQEELRRSVSAMVGRQAVIEFYVGRCCNVEVRTPKHDADTARCVYESSSPDNAMDVENDLIQFFYDHPKCNNESAPLWRERP